MPTEGTAVYNIKSLGRTFRVALLQRGIWTSEQPINLSVEIQGTMVTLVDAHEGVVDKCALGYWDLYYMEIYLSAIAQSHRQQLPEPGRNLMYHIQGLLPILPIPNE